MLVLYFQDPGLSIGLPLYQRLIELAGGDSSVLVPEGQLTKISVSNCFKKLAETTYISFQGYLKCGNLGSRILVSPPPIVSIQINFSHWKNIYFTCVIVDLALLGHETLHTQNKLFFPIFTMYYLTFRTNFNFRQNNV